MTPLRQRMIDDMQLRGLSARTQETYVTAVRQLAKHYRRSPDEGPETATPRRLPVPRLCPTRPSRKTRPTGGAGRRGLSAFGAA
jgi:integrase-like protein